MKVKTVSIPQAVGTVATIIMPLKNFKAFGVSIP